MRIPKGSISRKISRLEEDVGVRLLNRTTRSVTLTEAGRLYYEQCRKGIAELDAAGQLLEGVRAEPTGTLRISAPSDFGVEGFGDLIETFLARYEKANIEMVLTDDYVDLIGQRIDLAIRFGVLADSSLIARKLGDEQAVICASPAYLQRRGTPEALSDLLRHDCIVQGQSPQDASWQLTGPEGAVSVPLNSRVSGCGVSLVTKLVLAGFGIGMLPRSVVQGHMAAGRLKRVLASFASPAFGIYAVYPSNRQVSPSVQAFLEIATERTARYRR